MPADGVALDAIDRQLLQLLQADGRRSFADLARDVGLSHAAVRSRAQRLLSTGVLRVVGLVAPSIIGIEAMAAIGISTVGGSAALHQQLGAMPEVSFLVATTGRYDAILEVRCESDEHLRMTLEEVRNTDGVRAVESGKYLYVAKEAYAAPSRHSALTLDEVDHALLRELEWNGRASYVDLSQRVGLSQAATAVRVKRLLDIEALRIAALIDPMSVGVAEWCGFTISVAGGGRRVADAVAAIEATTFVAVTAGRWDIIGSISAESDEAVLDVLDRIRATEGIRALESHAHLALIKEQYQRLGASVPSPA